MDPQTESLKSLLGLAGSSRAGMTQTEVGKAGSKLP